MARQNKTQVYAVQWLNSQNKSPEDIANELKLEVSAVVSILEKHHTQQESTNIKTKKSSSKSNTLMITETAAKKTKNVAIMTKEASEYNDSVRGSANTNNPQTQKAIFRPKNND